MKFPYSKTCIFCGAGKLSREHVLPEWLQRLDLEQRPSYHMLDRYAVEDVSYRGTDRGKLHRPGNLLSQRLRCVCEPCNNEWMARTQDAAIPVLTPLILEGPTELSEDARWIVARWAAMTACVIEIEDLDTAMASQEARSKIKDGEWPNGWAVGIVGRAENPRRVDTFHRAFGVVRDGNSVPGTGSHLTLIVLGKLAIFCIGLGSGLSDRPIGPFMEKFGLQTVYPLVTQGGPALTTRQVGEVLQSFEDLVDLDQPGESG